MDAHAQWAEMWFWLAVLGSPTLMMGEVGALDLIIWGVGLLGHLLIFIFQIVF